VLARLGLLGLLLLAVACLASACSAGPAPAQHEAAFHPPRWSRVHLGAPISGGADDQLAGWDGGYLLVSGGSVIGSSADGRDWRWVRPPGLTTLVSPSGDSRMTAGYGAAAYVAGWSSGTLTVWRTADGTQWQKTALDVQGLAYHNSLELDVNIAAGPRGVIVVANDAVTPPSFTGFYVWRSFNYGKTFGQPIWVPLYSEESSGAVEVDAVEATTNGFLVSGNNGKGAIILSSANGLHWAGISAEAEIAGTSVATTIGGNSSIVVVFNRDPKPGQPLAMYRHGNTWSPSAVDPGHLPDAGVVPENEVIVEAVCNWGTGFIAIGDADGAPQNSGMVWYSTDGSQWIRQPVRSNGFDAVAIFMDAAISNAKVLIVAYPGEGSDLLMWQADAPG
jgi:hypothetical protein